MTVLCSYAVELTRQDNPALYARARPPFPPLDQGRRQQAGNQPQEAVALSCRRCLTPPSMQTWCRSATSRSRNCLPTKRRSLGDHPSAEADPSVDQQASLKQVVAAGSVPYADFSLFGPHGLRLLRKQTFTSYTLNVATGEWSRKEQPGPSFYHSWVEAWKVHRTALLLLETVDSERLDAYAEHVRCEHMERLRRTLHDKPAHGYTAARPWNAVFAAAICDGDYWTRELVTPATLWLSQRPGRTSSPNRRWGRPAEHRTPTR